VPVLARVIEATGIPTVTVTMMPDVTEQLRLSRVLGVEFPFGHAFGLPGDRVMQRAVAQASIDLLAGATGPDTRVDLDLEWPIDTRTAYKDWQPAEPSPVVKVLLERLAAERASGRSSR